MIGAVGVAFLAIGAALGCTALPVFMLLTSMIAAIALTLFSWARFGQTTLAARTLVSLPLYILWKIPVYLRLALGGKQGWNRTERPGE
jgi:hypothetical protein